MDVSEEINALWGVESIEDGGGVESIEDGGGDDMERELAGAGGRDVESPVAAVYSI